ncbi:wd g-beta repeat-containing protein [Cystoisospora suis]|uniref:Wd g-beta repeat-containing protein n=1 Tax=Cystoisospora suis TaxID=483139 RepID=A0A2C6L1Z0_9APIC|nr:wd g-beta repeat-containing protein [Cystoisospora suis]
MKRPSPTRPCLSNANSSSSRISSTREQALLSKRGEKKDKSKEEETARPRAQPFSSSSSRPLPTNSSSSLSSSHSRVAPPSSRLSTQRASQAGTAQKEREISRKQKKPLGDVKEEEKRKCLDWVDAYIPARRYLKYRKDVLRDGPIATEIFSNPHDRNVLCLDIHSSGLYAVSGSADHALRLYRLPSSRCSSSFSSFSSSSLIGELFLPNAGHTDWVSCCSFTPHNCVVSGGMDGKVCLWEIQKYLSSSSSSSSRSALHPSRAINPSRSLLGGASGKMREEEERERSPHSRVMDIPQTQVERVRENDRSIVCRASTNRIRCIELKGGGHLASVSQIQIAGRGARGSSCSLYYSRRGTEGEEENVCCMTSGYDGFLRVWDLGKGKKEIAALSSVSTPEQGGGGANRIVHPSPITHFIWMNSVAIAGTKAGSLKIWDVNAGRLLASSKQQLASHPGGIGCLQLAVVKRDEGRGFSKDETTGGLREGQSLFCYDEARVRLPFLFSGGIKDGKLCMWDTRCFSTPVAHIQAHAGSLNAILILSDGSDREERKRSPAGSSEFPAESSQNESSLYDPNPYSVCTLGADGACRFWDVRKLGKEGGGGQGSSESSLGHNSMKSILLPGRHKQAFLCGEAIGEGLVIGGAADGCVYLMNRWSEEEEEEEEEEEGEGDERKRIREKKNKIDGVCWGYGCDKKGAVQVLRAVVTPEKMKGEEEIDEEEEVSDKASEKQGNLLGRRERVHGIVAGGDDGHPSFLGFG